MKVASGRHGMVREATVVYGCAVMMTMIAALVITTRAPQPVVSGTVSLGIPTPLIYQLPVFFPFGLLIGEILWEGMQNGLRSHLIVRSGLLLMLSLIAVLRLGVGIPISGHAMLIAYFLLDEILVRMPRHSLRILIGVAIGVEILLFKVWIWQDISTLVTGFGMGVGFWVLGLLATRPTSAPHSRAAR